MERRSLETNMAERIFGMIRRGFGPDYLALTGLGLRRALHFGSRGLFGAYKIPEQILIELQIFAILHQPISYVSTSGWPT